MKILLATDTWSPAVNGVVRSVQLLRRELQACGHEVRVLTLSGTCESTMQDDVYALGSVSAEQVYPGARVGVCPTSSLLRELEQWHPDIVHARSLRAVGQQLCGIYQDAGFLKEAMQPIAQPHPLHIRPRMI